MKQFLLASNRVAPFPESAPILSKHLDEKRLLAGLTGPNPLADPYVQQFREAAVTGLTKFFQHGCYNEEGVFNYRSKTLVDQIREAAVYYKLMEGSGYITPDKTTDFFQLVDQFRDSAEMTPDTSYLEWMVPTKMTLEIESRRTWNAYFQFVLMKEAGQVKFGRFGTATAQMVNDVWGSGMELDWTWLETNQFRVNFSRLAPKFKYASFDQKADAVYGLLTAGVTTAITGGTGTVIRDINIAENELMRYTDSLGNKPWENARFRIISCPENFWWLDMMYRGAGSSPQYPNFTRRPAITYTTKLSTANEIYLVVDKWERNEFATRVPLEAHGPQDDILKFATVISYREAYGAAVDVLAGRKLTFDPSDLDVFSINPPPLVRSDTV